MYTLTGLAPIIEKNLMNPTRDRVLLKPIYVQSVVKQSHPAKVCYEVIKVGPKVEKLRVGMHVLHISAAGDKIPDSDIEVVREEDVITDWYPPKDIDIPAPLDG